MENTDTRKRLIITSPAKSGLPTAYFKSFLDLVGNGIPGWKADVTVEDGNNALNLSRNIIVHDCIVNVAEYKDEDLMLMIDSDHKWDLNHLARILSHDYSKYHIVSGTYCKKRPGRPIWLGLAQKEAKVEENGLLECDFLPTGFLCVPIGVLRKIAANNPEREFYYDDEDGKTKVMCELFPIGVRGPRTAEARLERVKKILEKYCSNDEVQYEKEMEKIWEACYDEQPPGRCVGEDYNFSFLAKRAGFRLFIDTKCITPHTGTIDFPIEPHMVASPAPIPCNASDTTQW